MFGITQKECDSRGCGLSEAILVSEHLPECPKSGCPACYEQGQRDAIAAAVQRVEELEVSLIDVRFNPDDPQDHRQAVLLSRCIAAVRDAVTARPIPTTRIVAF
jgi:hypothetical protein